MPYYIVFGGTQVEIRGESWMKVLRSRVDQLCRLCDRTGAPVYSSIRELDRNGARASSLTSAACSPTERKNALREFRITMSGVIGQKRE